MAKLSKRVKEISEKVEVGKLYDFEEAVTLLKLVSKVKFNETVEIAVNLGVNPKKSDQMVRGSAVLPNGLGKEVRVAVFTQGEQASAAKEAGADLVGMEDLADMIKAGEMNFDVVIATPDAMRIVGQLGQVLGPRGLMPNPKVGTVTTNVAETVRNAKMGQVRFRTDKGGVVHSIIGKIDFDTTGLKQNIEVLLAGLRRLKQTSSKGVYMKKIILSTTMGPGLMIDGSSLKI